MRSQRPSGVFVEEVTTQGEDSVPDSDPNAARVAAALSSERLAPYLRATSGDLIRAVRLYEWNLAASGALYEALGILEVVLRNTLSAGLTAHHGTLPGHWYDDPLGVLSDLAHEDIAAARRRVQKLRRPETSGRVIAELNFGFWKFMLARRYEATLWTGHLRHGFPNLQPQSRTVVYQALDELHALRNRIAHHEPIHGRDLTADAWTIYRLLDWIDHDVRAWAVSLSRLQGIIAVRPSRLTPAPPAT
jgi:hypothetical protein